MVQILNGVGELWGFERGRIYNRRKDIHGRFKGQERGGIITPASYRLVIIVTGEDGIEHGYNDRWRADGIFEYFGEGQRGDMIMNKGNNAIATHLEDGRDLILFKKTSNGVRFEGAMICAGHHIERAQDQDGNMRDAIVFELQPLDSLIEATDEIAPEKLVDLDLLRDLAFASATDAPNRRTTNSASIVDRSRHVRDYVLARANARCEGCQGPAPFHRKDGTAFLEPHHIRRLSDGGPDNPRFVIALCPNCHRRVHYGADGAEYNGKLLDRMKDIETN